MEQQVLKARRRGQAGSAAARRLRREGQVPGVVYGHGEEVISITLVADDVHRMVSSGHHLVTLDVEGKKEPAIIKEVQWDTWSREVLHVDFGRVALDESVTVTVEITSHGTPKAVASGAALEQPLHEIEVVCTADRIPDAILVELAAMEVGQAIRVADLDLPEGVEVRIAPETIVFALQEPREEPAAAEEEVGVVAEGAAAEPEVIGKGGKEPDEETGAES